MTDLPNPLVPPEVDLTDFAYMPLDVRRLLKSETWIDAADDPKLGHALVCLWAESWHQIPAASLPDNDRVLARFAMCSREEWAAIKDKALKAWIKCSDGLLYHPVVAEKALAAWEGKRQHRERTRAATEARQRQRQEQQAKTTAPSNGKRDGQRDDVRDVDVTHNATFTKGEGEGEGERKGEEGGAARPAAKAKTRKRSAEPYVIELQRIRLTRSSYDGLKADYPTIPDFDGELRVIDAALSAELNPGASWFFRMRSLLGSKARMIAEGPRNGATMNGASHSPETRWQREDDQWRVRLTSYAKSKRWRADLWGPESLAAGCLCPARIIAEFPTLAPEGQA